MEVVTGVSSEATLTLEVRIYQVVDFEDARSHDAFLRINDVVPNLQLISVYPASGNASSERKLT